MWRLIFFIGLLYVFFKVRKLVKQIRGSVNQSLSNNQTNNQLDDLMIKDPVCEVYFPRREGVHLNDHGKDLYFCSKKCRDTYLLQKKSF
ncbi:MAG: hypothetical protein C0403_15670 [Desulfobacterium sp.]|nr:hypothetical protein [Desulfobacterium sp.]